MIAELAGYFDSTGGKMPSQETLPTGIYRYIFFSSDLQVIISSLQQEHKDLSNRNFNIQTDDAGMMALTWMRTIEEITLQVEKMQSFAASRSMAFDPVAYKKQVVDQFSKTTIKIDPDYGSSTLFYEPNPAARAQYMNRLGQLFPNANIFQAK